MTIARPVAALRGQRNFRVAFAAQSGAVGTNGKPQATQPLIQHMFLQVRLDLTGTGRPGGLPHLDCPHSDAPALPSVYWH